MSDHDPSDPSPSHDDPRVVRVEQILFSHLQRRLEGEAVDDDALIAQYPELMPELADQLRLHQMIADLRAGNQIPETLSPEGGVTGSLQTGTVIGHYKLLQQIGQGGMGAVWMAEQREPVRRRVALKLIKSGLDNKQVIARFEAERQALAMMNHQNIAKVLDAGMTDDGRPYFAMELVQGIPFNEYCDQHKLSLKDRLELFIPVCHAIQHAHQKGILHRDLKPSNVLVTLYDGKPVPKVIDFGLAKALQPQTHLTDKTMFTEFGQVVGTLQYMSPEQAEMNALDVDTRTDIYSLGVMLYESLTGSTPLDFDTLKDAALFHVLQLIKEQEPPKPSTRLSESGEAIVGISQQRKTEPRRLQQILRGELDWIVMKALEKDRTRRYETANGLAVDLQNYLSDEPVSARPPSASYTVSKFLRKHSALVAATSTIFLLLIVGIAATSWLWLVAEDARRDAKSSEELAIQERDFATKQSRIAETLRGLAEMQAYSLALKLAHQQHGVPDLRDHDSIATGAELDFLISRNKRSIPFEEERTVCWALSPDGKTVATCHTGGLVRLHDLGHQKVLAEFFPIGRSHVSFDSVEFFNDGLALTSGNPSKVCTFSLINNKLTNTYSNIGLEQIQVTPRQNRFYGEEVDERKIVGFDLSSGQKIGEWNYARSAVYIDSFEVSPDGSAILASAHDGSLLGQDAEVFLISTSGFDTIKSYPNTRPASVPPNLSTFSPDGKYFLVLAGEKLQMCSSTTGEIVQTFQNQLGDGIGLSSFSPDGNYLYSIEKLDTPASSLPTVRRESTGETSSLTIRATETGDVVQRIVSPTITAFVLAPDGDRMLADGRVWVREDSSLLNSTPVPEKPFYWRAIGSYDKSSVDRKKVRFLQDGKSFVTNGTLWPEELRAKKQLLESKIIAIAPDGSQLVTPGHFKGSLIIWDSSTGVELNVIRTFHSNVSYSADSQSIATWGPRDQIKVWDVTSAAEVASIQVDTMDGSRPSGIERVQLSGNGNYVIGQRLRAPPTYECRVWDINTGRETLTIDDVGSVATHPIRVSGNKLIVGARRSDHWCKEVWNLDTRTKRFTIPHVDFLSPSQRVLLVSAEEQELIAQFRKSKDANVEVGVFHLETGELKSSFSLKEFRAMKCFPSRDGRWLAVASDGVIHIHDTTQPKAIRRPITIKPDYPLPRLSLVFSDDNSRLYGIGLREILIWDTEYGIELIRFNAADERIRYSPEIFLALARFKFLRE